MSESIWPLQVTALLLSGFLATRCDFQSVEQPPSGKENLITDKVLHKMNAVDVDISSVQKKAGLNSSSGSRSVLLSQLNTAETDEKSGFRFPVLMLDEKHSVQSEAVLLVETANEVAMNSGIRPGDIILSVNNQRVSTIKQFKLILSKANKRVDLLVRRNGNVISISKCCFKNTIHNT